MGHQIYGCGSAPVHRQVGACERRRDPGCEVSATRSGLHVIEPDTHGLAGLSGRCDEKNSGDRTKNGPRRLGAIDSGAPVLDNIGDTAQASPKHGERGAALLRRKHY